MSSAPHRPVGTSRTAAQAPLVVRTVPLDLDVATSLVSLLPTPEQAPLLAWVRRGEGIVGWSEAARLDTAGASRFTDADEWWSHLAARAVVRDEVGMPGTGLVAMGSFAFADSPGSSTLVVPEVVVGRRGETAWVTTCSAGLDRLDAAPGPQPPPPAPVGLRFDDDGPDGDVRGHRYRDVVARAIEQIASGEVDKVVLARDLVAEADAAVDVRWPVGRLAERYAMCWTFCVDGLFGASPELLVRRERGLVTSRVLAGTIPRTGDDARDLTLAATLARSSKDLEEHEFAVRSVAEKLAAHCTSMNVPEAPFVLHLPNVMHLATDLAGVVAEPAPAAGGESTSSLRLASLLHPSAAVGGTPTAEALALIADLEGGMGVGRGRYAGPVGWIDADGDGEWAIGLRSATLDGARARLFAGCGVVADSDPDAELAESRAKLQPVRQALGVD